jgi:thiamine transport system substrate-binding protein
MLAEIPEAFKIDPGNFALPVDYGDVCINYDKAYFEAHNLPVPDSLEALIEPQYAGCWWCRTRPPLHQAWPS